jgi:iron complex outermembrane receptor protein
VTWPLADGAVELAPQLRLELAGDSPVSGAGPTIAGGGHPDAVTRLFVSSQLGVIARPTRWLRLRASGGLTQRPPTFLELFGNQGAVVGNPELRPESGWSVDGGFELAARRWRAVERAGLDVVGFYRSVDDLIQLVPNSQVTFVAANAGAATVAGLEASGALRVDWGTAARSRLPGWALVRAGITYMDAVDRSRDFAYLEGRQLPLRPRVELFARLEAGWGPIVGAYEIDYTSGNFLDPYNAFSVPRRVFHSAELSVDLRRWRGPTVTLLARNLTDRIVEVVPVQGHGQLRRPVADVAGFPLPGLTVFLTARWDVDPRAH